jgi:hypothetical protein
MNAREDDAVLTQRAVCLQHKPNVAVSGAEATDATTIIP